MNINNLFHAFDYKERVRTKESRKKIFLIWRGFFFLPACGKKGKKYHGVQERAVNKKKEETPKKESSVHSWGDRKAISSITAGRFCRCAGVEAIPS